MQKLLQKQTNYNIDGYLTLFLTLTLVSMISIFYILIKGVMQHSVAVESQIAAKTGSQSLLAEYHQELFRQYDVLFIDLSYGENYPSISAINERLKDNVAKNSSQWKLLWYMTCKDLLNLKVENTQIRQIQLATDNKAEAFRKQGISYMYEKSGILLAEDLLTWKQEVESFTITVSDLEVMRQQVLQFLEGNEEESTVLSQWYPQIFQNVELTREDKMLDLLMYLFKDDISKISRKQINPPQYFSERVENIGNGSNPKVDYSETMIDKLLFEQYIGEHVSNYMNVKEERVLSYELEYVLFGKDNDFDNLAAAMRELLLLREVANLNSLYSDLVKRDLVLKAGVALALLTKTEGMVNVYHAAIFLGWSFAESIYDMRTLLEGGNVPLVKTSSNWFLDLDALLEWNTYDTFSDGNNIVGLSYKQYLQLLMCIKQDEKITSRFLDVVEMNIRNTKGNENFRIDGCSDSIQTEIDMEGNGIKSKFIQWSGFYE